MRRSRTASGSGSADELAAVLARGMTNGGRCGLPSSLSSGPSAVAAGAYRVGAKPPGFARAHSVTTMMPLERLRHRAVVGRPIRQIAYTAAEFAGRAPVVSRLTRWQLATEPEDHPSIHRVDRLLEAVLYHGPDAPIVRPTWCFIGPFSANAVCEAITRTYPSTGTGRPQERTSKSSGFASGSPKRVALWMPNPFAACETAI